jgi:hypothetical protein
MDWKQGQALPVENDEEADWLVWFHRSILKKKLSW